MKKNFGLPPTVFKILIGFIIVAGAIIIFKSGYNAGNWLYDLTRR